MRCLCAPGMSGAARTLGRVRHYAQRLSGGKPNSLGDTVAVVADVLAHPEAFDELFACYFADDALVRLRVSNCLKRVAAERPALLEPYLDRLLDEVAYIPQASTQWTLAQLLLTYTDRLSPAQLARAKGLLRRPLDGSPEPAAWHDDWIVVNMTLNTLQAWARDDAELRAWLVPHLRRLAEDPRKSVRGRATKFLGVLEG